MNESAPSTYVSKGTNEVYTIARLTDESNDLCLDTKLVLEASSEVTDFTMTVTRDVRNLADLVEHVTSSASKDHDDGDSGPHIAVLDNRKQVWPSFETKTENTENGHGGDGPE